MGTAAAGAAKIMQSAALSLLLSVTTAQRTPLSSWSLAPLSATSGDVASFSESSFSPGAGWAPATVPCTVMACQIQQGVFPALFQDLNIYSINTSAYDEPWVYATKFELPTPLPPGAHIGLSFEGFNYRGFVYVNGALVADNSTLVGAFNRLRFDVTAHVAAGANGLAVSLRRPVDYGLDHTPTDTDLAITFVDWAPQQPDSSMGLWQPVVLEVLPSPLSLAFPLVTTTTNATLTSVTLGATIFNGGAEDARVVLAAQLLGPDGRIFTARNGTFTVPAGSEFLATLPPLAIPAPQLWWPFEFTGRDPDLHALTVRVFPAAGGGAGDTLTKRVGLREAQGELVDGARSLSVNGVPVLVRGGGWAPDLLLRYSPERTRKELLYVRDMGLNAIRLEGKMNDDNFFEQADALGIMILPGWCCCDAWQHWPVWKAEQDAVARASMVTQARRLRASASVLAFLISSDELPPASVEQMYLDAISQEAWAIPTISAASRATSSITGPTGVKMNGPYSWVPPNYWLLDAQPPHHPGAAVGGAWGFNTEGGPGQSPMTLASLTATIRNASALWPPWPNSGWGHAGAPAGNFHDLDRFNGPLEKRYGSAGDLKTYLALAAAQNYEGYRAMYEGFARNKVTLFDPKTSMNPATGIIQWMLNSAWPSNVWNL